MGAAAEAEAEALIRGRLVPLSLATPPALGHQPRSWPTRSDNRDQEPPNSGSDPRAIYVTPGLATYGCAENCRDVTDAPVPGIDLRSRMTTSTSPRGRPNEKEVIHG